MDELRKSLKKVQFWAFCTFVSATITVILSVIVVLRQL
jgi:hypothetical protein